jgi:ABC transporter with metal-binding/Fe-S-binding domain ATP-binding protein
MCGIVGCFFKDHEKFVKKAAKIIEYRGIDEFSILSKKDYSIAHLLHSIVGFVKQPIIYKNNILIANCEIYNYLKLAKKYDLNVLNDADLMIKLITKIGLIKAINEFDGVYAACYITKNKVYLFRDTLGLKPLWFSTKNFCFASEKKALVNQNIKGVVELNPRNILIYDLKTNKLKFKYLGFLKIKKIKIENPVDDTKLLLINSVKKRIPKNVKMGVLFSGGIDSTIIAFILKSLNVDFTCYTSGTKSSEDIFYAKKVAKLYGFNLKINYFDEKKVKDDLKLICNLIESNSAVKVGVSIPFFYACKLAKKDNVKVIFSGLGSEEIFAGYKRFESSTDVNKECLFGLKQLYERDLYRDDIITMYHNIELRLPFLDYNLIKLALNIPPDLKINEKEKKIILRLVGKKLGLDELVYTRKKRAAQYGSKSDKILKKLSKGFNSKSSFLNSLRPLPNLKLGALFSGGKDSNLALNIMSNQNYEVSCLLTMITSKDYSYMFQKTSKKIVTLQSLAMNIPVLFKNTKAKKEIELNDLKSLIKKARDEYYIDGIITGALFSNYQRDRIFEICESLNLKIFSPLWHKNQELEIRELLMNNFEFILVKIAALGLNSNWLGKIITKEELYELIKLKKKYSINIAGEGGEYESIVLNAPLFTKKLKIIESEIFIEDENTADLIIKKIKLIDKKV